MSQKEKNQGENQEESHNAPSELPVQYGSGEQERAKHRDSSANNSHRKSNIMKKIILFLRDKKNQFQFQNIIAFLALAVGIWLAIVTYQVYKIAAGQSNSVIKSANASQKSADAAKLSADLQKEALDSQKSAKARSDIVEAARLKRDTDFINKQKKGIDAQIGSLKETQKEFEIENKPYIQIVNIEFQPPLKVGNPVEIGFDFVNYGKQPVKCLINKCGIYLSTFKNFNFTDYVKYNNVVMNSYMGNGARSHQHMQLKEPITQEQLAFILSSNQYFYVLGEFEFQNVATLKKSIYHYNYRLYMVNNNSTSEGVVDTTIDEKSIYRVVKKH